jgi:hypothetical protein
MDGPVFDPASRTMSGLHREPVGKEAFSAAPSFRCFNLHKELFFSTACAVSRFASTGGDVLLLSPFAFFPSHFNSPPVCIRLIETAARTAGKFARLLSGGREKFCGQKTIFATHPRRNYYTRELFANGFG